MPATTADRQIEIIKANGVREGFEPEKLKASLTRAGADERAIATVMSHMENELKPGMSTRDIYEHAYQVLADYGRPVAERYSLRRAIMELGPTGFPFEDLVEEIFKEKGFETLTRQTVLGGCVPHEIDVVAWSPSKLIMVEAKFHNELGTKSDLKVALYIKARMDDLKQSAFHYGKRERGLDEFWLVTNTKFTSTAIRYGTCQNLVMIGWNYPEKGNLANLIEESPRLLELIAERVPQLLAKPVRRVN